MVSNGMGRVFSFDDSGGRVLVTNSARLNFQANQDFTITARIAEVSTV